MPNKLQAYAEQAERTARQITGSHLAWTAFLTTAARLYKYPYNEQLMIYMQRPEATACAEYDFWNEKMGRYVRRGSTGIALIDATGYKPRLKYVFDVSDTGGKENARRVNLWELKEAHTDSVSAMLERNYGVSGRNGLTEQFEAVASRLASEYWRDHSRDILGIVADSYLEEYDDYNIEVAFKNAAAVSITYSLMSRCGMQPEDHFEHEDFFSIFDFNTPRTVAALGTAVSEINEQVLRQIEVTIRNYEREHSAERTAEHGEQPDLHDERRLHDSRPEDRGAGAAPRQVRTDAPEVPEGASPHPLEPDDLGGDPVSAPAGDRAGSAEPLRADDAEAGVGGRSDGSSESPRPNEMGGPDEHLQGAGGGSDSRGADLRITEHPARGGQLSFFPTEAEQITAIEEAESVAQTPFAFSVSQEQLDHVLRLGGNEDNTRMVIAAAFQKQKSTEDIAALLQNTFHGGNGFKTPEGELSAWYAVDGIHIAPGRSAEYVRSAQVIAWQDAAAHISQLMDSGAYASNVELAEAGQHERMQLAQALWYLKHDLSDEAREQGYDKFSDLETGYMDTIRDSIEDTAKDEAKKLRELPVYPYPADHARENGELDVYRASFRANVSCKDAIEAAIRDNYRDNRLDTAAVGQVAEQFGQERILYVLAATVRHFDYDGRISRDNKRWANTIPVYENKDGMDSDRSVQFVVSSHPGLTDLFLTQARHEQRLRQPLTADEIKTEAARLLGKLQEPVQPNSPNGTHFMAEVSRDFMERAGAKDTAALQKLLPFSTLALTTLKDRRGVFAMIGKDEDRSQSLRRPSVRSKLQQASAEQKQPAAKKKDLEL